MQKVIYPQGHVPFMGAVLLSSSMFFVCEQQMLWRSCEVAPMRHGPKSHVVVLMLYQYHKKN